MSLLQTHYLPHSNLSPQGTERKSFSFSKALLDLVSMILNLEKVSWFCFLRDQLISYTVAETLASEENLCLPPAFAHVALEAVTSLLACTASCNTMRLASAPSLLNLKQGFGKPELGELLQASHKNRAIQRLEQNSCRLTRIEVLYELVPSSHAQEF